MPPALRDDAGQEAAEIALFGKDPMPRLVDVQPLLYGAHETEGAAVRLYQRSEGFQRIVTREEPFFPFFLLSDIDLLRAFPRSRFQFQPLGGDGFFQHLVVFKTWPDLWEALRCVEAATERRERRPDEVYLVANPAQQYLMQTGRACFRGMAFDDLHRLQLDIETYSEAGFPNAERPGDEIIIIALSDNRGWSRLIDGQALPERTLLEELVRVLCEKDPDVIEGHNIFAYDFDYILKRCRLHGLAFTVGRDGSEPRTYDSSMRFAERTVDFPALKIAGRHVIDTYFQVMAFDVFKRDLPGYGLKAAAKYFGFAPEGRTYVEGADIARAWRGEPQRLLDYALDDVTETERLARRLSGSTFYLTQMLPMPYGQVARTGPAAKIESLFAREYLRQRHALPRSEWGSQSVGGYTDVFITGVVGPVVYADVESLYPSIMLNYDVQPKGDTLGLFPTLLRRLTDLRLETKRQMRSAEDAGTRGELDARQSSYKILINCFDPTTEIMTLSGPKNVRDVEVGDLVYSIHPDTLEAEIKPVTHVHEQAVYRGDMVRLENRHVDFLVTPNHRLLTNKVNGYRETSYQWREARDLFETKCRHYLPPRSPVKQEGPPATVDLIAHCQRLGLDFKTDGNDRIKELRRQAHWIPRTFALSDWMEFVGWFISEGHLYKSKRKDFGYNAQVIGQDSGCYRVGINPPGGKGIAPVIKAKHRKLVDYEGSIHCISVADNHTVLAGRNGKFNWIGQSFYGSMGFSLSLFNDFEEADRVTRTGQQILRQMMKAIRARGGTVIEVDTDGVFFIPPEDARGANEERAFTEALTEALPEGIRVGFDGRFRKMLSYKKKNYALLTYEGRIKFKGSSLVARSSERFGRRFVREAVRLLLDEDVQSLHDLYVETRVRIEASDWKDAGRFARTETLKDTVAQYETDVQAGRRTRAAAYELAAAQAEKTGQPARKGDRITYYVTGSKASVTAFQNCRLADDWDPAAPDENTAYYLKRLDQFAAKFEPFFEEHAFRRLFAPEDLFGFSPKGIALRVHHLKDALTEHEDEVPF